MFTKLSDVEVGQSVLFEHAGPWEGGCRRKMASVGVKVDPDRVLAGRKYYALGPAKLVSVL